MIKYLFTVMVVLTFTTILQSQNVPAVNSEFDPSDLQSSEVKLEVIHPGSIFLGYRSKSR